METSRNSSQLLVISDLSIVYQSKKQNLLALDKTTIEIEKNTFVAIVGESGCGKSTLALSIIGLLAIPPAKIASGSISYKSVNLVELKENQRRQYRGTEIAMIFQEPLTSLNPVYKVGDQIAEAIVVREERQGGKEIDPGVQVMQKTYKTNTPDFPSRLPRFRRGALAKILREETLDALKRVRIAESGAGH